MKTKLKRTKKQKDPNLKFYGSYKVQYEINDRDGNTSRGKKWRLRLKAKRVAITPYVFVGGLTTRETAAFQ